MKTKKRYRGYGTILLFALAATLLIFSTVGSSRAALSYTSEIYGAQLSMLDIGVSLVENDETVSYRNYNRENREWDKQTGVLLANMLTAEDGTEETLQTGKAYDEKLQVRNSGTIDEYVRVTVYCYWAEEQKLTDGTTKQIRRTDLDPSLIDLHFTDTGDWIVDEQASTAERTVLYYKHIVPGLQATGDSTATGGETSLFADKLTIKGLDGVEVQVTEEKDENGNTVTKFIYNGATFVLEADVDAVQTHNAVDAIKSAWGVDVVMNGDSIDHIVPYTATETAAP